MRTHRVNLSREFTEKISLRRQGENLVTDIIFDFKSWVEEFGEGTISLIHRRANDTAPYPVLLDISGTTAIWHVNNSDTAQCGMGSCELQYVVDDQLAKSCTYYTLTAPALGDPSETPPEPWESWVDSVLNAADRAEAAAEEAEGKLDAPTEPGTPGQVLTLGEGGKAKWEDPQGGGGGTSTIAWKPTVDAQGNISWTRTSSETAPEIQNIKGDKGDPGEQGPQGPQGLQGPAGADGAPGQKGDTGSPGQNGSDGADGVTFTPSVDSNGNISWTNDGGMENPPTQNIKGPKGDTGAPGADGADGADGHTPVKGVDYWTAEDQADIVQDVLEALPTWTGGSY